jgi:hypothetical protein
LRAKLPELRQALTGRVQPHHLVLIGQILRHVEFLEQAIAQVQAEIERCLYAELGLEYFDQLDTARMQRHHVRRLEQLGYTVTLTPTAA